ncbi:MAG: hypothetical protein EYC62_05415 [Alphaproteobacteria bacterium]|nr:MAG: hypothetical protein EYC62_05415 [Alphaproteobacteria bacterium]
MSKNYVDGCIEEALRQSGGNRQKACQILLARCAEDQLLEDGLFANFREAATMAHVQRVAHKLEGKPQTGATANGEIDFAGMIGQLQKNMANQDPLSASTLKPAPGQQAHKISDNPGHGNNLRAIADAFKKPFKKSSPKS